MAVEFGKYQLLQKIGSGGMGQVFLARTVGTQAFEKLVVIKRLLPHLSEDEEFLSLFLEEARVAACFNHPNLIQIFELGEFAGSHYLAMEYVAGENLRGVDSYLRSVTGEILPLGMACRIIADAAAGLDCAHNARDAQGRPLALIHRDVSPQNILVGFDGAVKLIDFGVAKSAGKQQGPPSAVLRGKCSYMSPEQVDGGPLDARSDVFSLGIVFWELLTGKRLFKGDSERSTLRLVTACQVPLPSKRGAPSPEVDALVMTALARAPELRYPDAATFRLAIEDFILEQRLQASAAHLATFMRSLYKERIARLEDPVTMDQLEGPLDFEPGTTSPPFGSAWALSPENTSEPSGVSPRGRSGSHPRLEMPAAAPVRRSGEHLALVGGERPRGRSGSYPSVAGGDVPWGRSGSHPKLEGVPVSSRTEPLLSENVKTNGEPESLREVTQTAASLPSARETLAGRSLLFFMMALGAGLALASFWLLTAGFGSTANASSTPSPRVSPSSRGSPPNLPPPPLEQPSPPSRPAPVKVWVRSQPPGATLRVGGEEKGVTPLEYTVKPDASPENAQLVLSGYDPVTVSLSSQSGPQVSVVLVRKKTPPPPPPPPPALKTER